MVYELFEHGMNPEAPLFAGMPLKYPYAVQLLFAKLMTFIPLSPPVLFSILSGICIIIFVLLIDRVARYLSTDRTFRCVAVFAVLFGFSFIQSNPLYTVFRDFGIPIGETRLGTNSKFVATSAFFVGVTMNALVVLGLVRVLKRAGSFMASLAMVGGGILVGGIAYPPTLPPSAAWVGVALVQLVLIERPRQWRVIIPLASVSAIACVVMLPYLLSITGGKSETAALHFPSIAKLAPNLRTALVLLAVPAGIAICYRERFHQYVAANRSIFTFLLLSVAFTLTAFLLAAWPAMIQYKLLVATEIPLGLLIAGPLATMLADRRKLTVCLMALMALPFAYRITSAVVFGYTATDPVFTSGRDLLHQDPEQRALYVWIDKQTPKDAVFLDTYLTVPPLGKRRLWVGLDTRREDGELTGKRDGWLVTAREIHETVVGVDPAALAERVRIAEAVLLGREQPIADATLDELAREVGDRPVFIVARDAGLRQRLAGSARLELDFENQAAAVFRLRPPE